MMRIRIRWNSIAQHAKSLSKPSKRESIISHNTGLFLIEKNHFENCRRESHDRSKKHKEKVRILRKSLLEEEGDIVHSEEDADNSNSEEETPAQEEESTPVDALNDVEDVDLTDEEPEEEVIAKSRSKKKKAKKVMPSSAVEVEEMLISRHQPDEPKVPIEKISKKKKKQQKQQQNGVQVLPTDSTDGGQPDQLTEKSVPRKELGQPVPKNETKNASLHCGVCRQQFPSKNKLFDHLKATKHAIFIDKNAPEEDDNPRSKRKGRKK